MTDGESVFVIKVSSMQAMAIFGHMTANSPLKTNGEPHPPNQPEELEHSEDVGMKTFSDKAGTSHTVDTTQSSTPSGGPHFTMDASPTRRIITQLLDLVI